MDPVTEAAVPARRARVGRVPVPVDVAVMTTTLVGPVLPVPLGAAVRYVRGAHRVGVGRGIAHLRVIAPVGGVVQVHPAHPRGDSAVVEADPQVVFHLHRALEALHAPHQIRVVVTGRQEIGDEHPPRGGLPFRLQNERVRDVTAGDHLPVHGAQSPASVLLVPQDRAEHGRGVEAREAQPVDAPVPGHQRPRVQVREQCVVLQRGTHGPIQSSPPTLPTSPKGVWPDDDGSPVTPRRRAGVPGRNPVRTRQILTYSRTCPPVE